MVWNRAINHFFLKFLTIKIVEYLQILVTLKKQERIFMIKKSIINALIAFVFVSMFISCESDDSNSPIEKKEYITYIIDALSSNVSSGTNGELRTEISKSVDSLIPTGLEIFNIEKPKTLSGEIEADNNQIKIFNERFKILDNVWNMENYSSDTTMHFYVERNIKLKRSNQTVYLAEYKYARFLPLITSTKWVYEKDSNQFIEFVNDTICNFQFEGNYFTLKYQRLNHINILMPDSSSIKFGFVSGIRGFFTDPNTKEKHYFVKQ